MPVSWKGTVQQYAGHLHRKHATKTDVRIIDFVDTGHSALQRMWDKRHSWYREKGPSLRYRAPVIIELQGHMHGSGKADASLDVYLPVSQAGQEVLDYVRQPIQGRKPVGYDRELLESYHPNEIRYLAQDIRNHLHNIGRSPDGARPAGTYAPCPASLRRITHQLN